MPTQKIFDILPPKKFVERKVQKPERFRKLLLGKIFIFFALIFLLIGFFSYFALAKVKIEIWPETKPVYFKEEILATTKVFQVDILNKKIPAMILKISDSLSQEFSSSGKIEKKAEGTIRVYNNYYQPVTLRAQTRFQPALDEVLYFCTQQKITIPAKGYIDTKVVACRPGKGEKYNIEPSKFSVPGLLGTDLFFYVYAESFQSMKGGGTFSQVIEEDLENAKNLLTEKLFEKIKESLSNLLKTKALAANKPVDDFIVLDKAIQRESLDFSSTAKAGDQTSSFEGKIKGTYKILVFKKSDLEKFAKEYINQNISEDEKLYEKSLKLEFQQKDVDFELGNIVLEIKFSGKIYSAIDSNFLKEALRGQSIESSKIILEHQPEIIRAQITAWPFWTRRIPENPERIEVEINLD
jgi:hypothetical protein